MHKGREGLSFNARRGSARGFRCRYQVGLLGENRRMLYLKLPVRLPALACNEG
ncbi:MAG: hypothetical protein LBU32_15440 [Clostridiales bacterium]|nr:hypothetical protein [Clostridiales bacterium]